MPRQDLMHLVMNQFDQQYGILSLHEVVQGVLKGHDSLTESDVKSAVLSLLRRNELVLTDDFKLELRLQPAA
jgi:hypothetical protein